MMILIGMIKWMPRVYLCSVMIPRASYAIVTISRILTWPSETTSFHVSNTIRLVRIPTILGFNMNWQKMLSFSTSYPAVMQWNSQSLFLRKYTTNSSGYMITISRNLKHKPCEWRQTFSAALTRLMLKSFCSTTAV